MTIADGPVAVSSLLQPAIKRNKGNTALSPALSEARMKRGDWLKAVVGFIVLVFIKTSFVLGKLDLKLDL